jgi:hypothetical protein
MPMIGGDDCAGSGESKALKLRARDSLRVASTELKLRPPGSADKLLRADMLITRSLEFLLGDRIQFDIDTTLTNLP